MLAAVSDVECRANLRVVHHHLERIRGTKHGLMPERCADTINNGGWAHGQCDGIDAE